MNVVWHKVWRDLAHNKARTALVVLSTAVGLFALGMVFGMRDAVRAWLAEDYRISAPAHVTFWATGLDQEVEEIVRQEPNVADAEGKILATIRWKREGETDWRDGTLVARTDYAAQRIEVADLVEGHWPADRELAVERQSSRYFDVPLGTTSDVPIRTDVPIRSDVPIRIVVEFEGYEQHLPVTGVVRAHNDVPPQFGGPAYLYATPETVVRLTGREGLTTLDVRLASFDSTLLDEAAERITDRLERMGLSVGNVTSPGTDTHFLQSQVDAVLLLLTAMGILALGLSVFLIVNTMNALVAQQVWQIGVMKVLGATSGRVVRIYLANALVYGGIALLLAVSPGAVVAYLTARPLLDLFNVTPGAFHITPGAAGVQVVVGLAVPLLAALGPIVGGARISPHACLSTYGLGLGFGRGWLDHLIGSLRRLPRPLALSLRNTFRRKARVALTLCALILCGITFTVAMSIRSSLDRTIEMRMQDLSDDVMVRLKRTYPTARLIDLTESIPGVTRAEVWSGYGTDATLASGEERYVYLWGLPPDSRMINPRIVGGRWLSPGDGRAIVLNSKVAAEAGIRIGDQVVFHFDGRASAWTVVGLILNASHAHRTCFVPFDALAREIGSVNRGRIVRVQSAQHDARNRQALMRVLYESYTTHDIEVNAMQSADEAQEQTRSMFDILTYLMLAMTMLAAAVGSMGLMGTLSMNVVERNREIGVLRAIGATSPAIAGIVVGEGALLGVVSWLFAVPLSYPAAKVVSDAVGYPFMGAPLDFRYSASGAMCWLAVVIALSVLASLWPALRATKISVREALAYE